MIRLATLSGYPGKSGQARFPRPGNYLPAKQAYEVLGEALHMPPWPALLAHASAVVSKISSETQAGLL